MSSIIFKDINSNDIQGLIISNLPPISKPQVRTEITEIEGLDGDIVDEVGYKAYDKTISISLTRNYDINNIIKYFSGKGNLVLSNEPDKIYKASIYKQIDYERLIRFKTANVTFHVQPYKYLKDEKYSTAEKETITGNSIIINDGIKVCKNTVYGNSIQNGEPTPDNIVDIVNIGSNGFLTEKIVSKNLYNDATKKSDYYVNNNGVETSNINYEVSEYIKVYGYDYISLSGNTYIKPSHASKVCFYDKNKNFVSYEDIAQGNNKYQVPSDAKYVRISIRKGDIIQLEVGDTTEYEKHQENIVKVNLKENELCKIGDIKDELDVVSGILTKRVGKVVFNGSEKWVASGAAVNVGVKAYSLTGIVDTIKGINDSNGYSNHFQVVIGGENWGTTEHKNSGYYRFASNNLYIRISETLGSTLDDFKNWLSNNNVVIYYELAQPEIIQLEKNDMKLYKPSHIDIDSEVQPSNVEIEYFKEYEVENKGLEDSKPIIHIKGEGTIYLKVNGQTSFIYRFDDSKEVYIDCDEQEAYLNGTLKNRNMQGDFPTLKSGINTIEWTGTITDIEILAKSRWL